MTPLKPREQLYWESYLATLPEIPTNLIVSAGYAGTPEITDELLALYLTGKKTAGSSIVEDFLITGDPLPKVGNYWIFLNSEGNPSCILQTTKVVINKFKDVPLEIAVAEGEGDLSLEYWYKVHSELYLPYLESWGIKDINEATVITEFFDIVYK